MLKLLQHIGLFRTENSEYNRGGDNARKWVTEQLQRKGWIDDDEMAVHWVVTHSDPTQDKLSRAYDEGYRARLARHMTDEAWRITGEF